MDSKLFLNMRLNIIIEIVIMTMMVVVVIKHKAYATGISIYTNSALVKCQEFLNDVKIALNCVVVWCAGEHWVHWEGGVAGRGTKEIQWLVQQGPFADQKVSKCVSYLLFAQFENNFFLGFVKKCIPFCSFTFTARSLGILESNT